MITLDCTLTSGRSVVYWMLTVCCMLVAAALFWRSCRLIDAHVQSYQRTHFYTAMSSRYNSLRKCWKFLDNPKCCLVEKIELVRSIPWGSRFSQQMHVKMIKKTFSWHLNLQEQEFFSHSGFECPVCEDILKEQEQVIMFPAPDRLALQHTFLHQQCFVAQQFLMEQIVLDQHSKLHPRYKLALEWAKQRLEELNLNHAVKRDIPRFYGILQSPPKLKRN